MYWNKKISNKSWNNVVFATNEYKFWVSKLKWELPVGFFAAVVEFFEKKKLHFFKIFKEIEYVIKI